MSGQAVGKTDEELLEHVLSEARSCFGDQPTGFELAQLTRITEDFKECPEEYRRRFGD